VPPILLALGTAVGYGIANHLAPVLGRRMPLAAVLLGSQVAGLAVSPAHRGRRRRHDGSQPRARAGRRLRQRRRAHVLPGQVGDLSVLCPVTATAVVVPVVVGLLAGDRSGALQFLGIPIARGNHAGRAAGPTPGRRRAPTRHRRRVRGAGWAGRYSPPCCSEPS
jgi:hypothetical protein